ncbi:hypothetical protein H4217_008947 [Coemansia sp. RSA 1939]|nr:hypothetical protein H4217_008947 [Coemansia sp. RSA 1939]KAJ2610108.1 hypothetical protein EV177_004134 [Coemansia sp. RSA 1804]KAJ2659401.1 hypothetical protein GGH99_006999 [Coemansia sp. RSA 1285]
MDSLVHNISSQIVYLNGYAAPDSVRNIDVGYWYANTVGRSLNKLMSPKILETAFYTTLQEFPIFVGYIQADAHRRVYVDVNSEALNMPVYADTSSDLDYLTLCKAGFNIHKLPADPRGENRILTYPRLSVVDQNPAYFHVLRLRDNTGILVYANIPHCFVDGYGFTLFMERWMEILNQMQQPQANASTEQPLS